MKMNSQPVNPKNSRNHIMSLCTIYPL